MSKKIFVMTGEVSGDLLAAWYVQHASMREQQIAWFGVGGNAMSAAGVQLIDRLEQFNVVGICHVLLRLPALLKKFFGLVTWLRSNAIDELVLVDFPGFNLLLAGYLRGRMPNLKITYLSPPQLWCWGAWRVKKLRRVTDRVIVLYPFEVAWYAARGVKAEWLGCPAAQRVAPFYQPARERKPYVVVIPGSRHGEVATLLPLFLHTIKVLRQQHPSLGVVIMQAPSIPLAMVHTCLAQAGMQNDKTVRIVAAQEERYTAMAGACVALAKPGTVTLELAVLGVPTVIGFKTSWLTYLLARPLVKVQYMGLANLLTGSVLMPECIQGDCTPQKLAGALEPVVAAYLHNNEQYAGLVEQFAAMRRQLLGS